MLLSFKVRISANERESSLLSLEKNSCYWPLQKIYLIGSRSASTELCNSFPTWPWESPRQKYLAFLAGCLSETRCGSIGLLSGGQGQHSLNRELLPLGGLSLLGSVRRKAR